MVRETKEFPEWNPLFILLFKQVEILISAYVSKHSITPIFWGDFLMDWLFVWKKFYIIRTFRQTFCLQPYVSGTAINGKFILDLKIPWLGHGILLKVLLDFLQKIAGVDGVRGFKSLCCNNVEKNGYFWWYLYIFNQIFKICQKVLK